MEYTDYELYQILESNGYKTHEKNLQILKEGLDSGKYEIDENSTNDDILFLLEECGYEPSEENLQILCEDEALYEEFLNEWKNRQKLKKAMSNAIKKKKELKQYKHVRSGETPHPYRGVDQSDEIVDPEDKGMVEKDGKGGVVVHASWGDLKGHSDTHNIVKYGKGDYGLVKKQYMKDNYEDHGDGTATNKSPVYATKIGHGHGQLKKAKALLRATGSKDKIKVTGKKGHKTATVTTQEGPAPLTGRVLKVAPSDKRAFTQDNAGFDKRFKKRRRRVIRS